MIYYLYLKNILIYQYQTRKYFNLKETELRNTTKVYGKLVVEQLFKTIILIGLN